MATRVRTSDFIASSKQYVKAAVSKRRLPKDLKDNLKNSGAKSLKAFGRQFPGYVAANATRADKNKDGDLTGREIAHMPADLRDNAKNFYTATNTLARVDGRVTPTRTQLFSTLERGVARHDWKGLLPLFDKSNRKGQSEIGVNDYQYIAEAMNLHMVNNQLPGPVTRADTLDLLKSVKVGRTPVETAPRYERYVGVATLTDGKKLQVEMFVKPVKGGFVFESARRLNPKAPLTLRA